MSRETITALDSVGNLAVRIERTERSYRREKEADTAINKGEPAVFLLEDALYLESDIALPIGVIDDVSWYLDGGIDEEEGEACLAGVAIYYGVLPVERFASKPNCPVCDRLIHDTDIELYRLRQYQHGEHISEQHSAAAYFHPSCAADVAERLTDAWEHADDMLGDVI